MYDRGIGYDMPDERGHRAVTDKEKMQALLDGRIPDTPPHWELAFQIEKEMFGMDAASVAEADRPAFYVDVHHRLVDELGWAAVPAGYEVENVARMKAALGDKALVAGYEGEGVFWMPTGADMMDFVDRMCSRPEEIRAEAREKCNRAKELCKASAEAGADFFVLTYDFGYNSGPFISPAQFRDLVTPYLAEIVATIHELGLKAILHSDGCIDLLLDQLYETGLDGYQSVDPQGHMDIRNVRERFPDWILMGNVACNMLQDADDGAIRRSVQYCMQHGGIGMPYIFSTSNCVFNGMPPESYRIMLDEYHRLSESAAAALRVRRRRRRHPGHLRSRALPRGLPRPRCLEIASPLSSLSSIVQTPRAIIRSHPGS